MVQSTTGCAFGSALAQCRGSEICLSAGVMAVRQGNPQASMFRPTCYAGLVSKLSGFLKPAGFQVEGGGEIRPRLGASRQFSWLQDHQSPIAAARPSAHESG